jgi:hypothetical protein
MASLTTGVTIADGDTVTATTLHQMIEDATFSTLTSSDLGASGANWLRAQSATPSVAAGDYFWWDTDHQTGQVFRVYDTDKKIWLAAGPDTFEYPARNFSGGTLPKGALCFTASSASNIAITTVTGPTLTFAGFAQDTAASGAWVGICPFGIGFVAWSSGATSGSSPSRGECFSNINCEGGKVTGAWGGATHIGAPSGQVHGLIYGLFLESYHADTGIAHGLRAKIWGPKFTYQPNEPY